METGDNIFAAKPNPQTDQQQNPLLSPQASSAPQAQGGQSDQGIVKPPPAPSHEQTVAAVRHFHEIASTMQKLLKNPGIGKKDIKGDIYMAGARLLGDGVLNLPDLMNELKTLPSDPIAQQKWVEGHLQQSQQAQMMVISHHAASAPASSGDFHQDWAAKPEVSEDDHGDIVSGLHDHYKSRGKR